MFRRIFLHFVGQRLQRRFDFQPAYLMLAQECGFNQTGAIRRFDGGIRLIKYQVGIALPQKFLGCRDR